MDILFRDNFLAQWKKYFGNSELPIIYYFGEGAGGAKKMPRANGRSCLICELARVRKGESLCYSEAALACQGARRYTGYSDQMSSTFRYFLSCGIEGKVTGERYKISPEVVDETMKIHHRLPAGERNIIFKRWDKLNESDNPDVVIFFAKGEVLSGLFTLANFDRVDPNGGVIAPFGAGCGSIIHYPFLEKDNEHPRCVLGLFDPSARLCVPDNVLSFAAPYKRFVQLAGYIDESFLTTQTWDKVRKRILS